MRVIEFIHLVRRMRVAQKAYYRNRLQADLIASKMFEAEVDKALKAGIDVRGFITLDTAGVQRPTGGDENDPKSGSGNA
jgi:hypothetical protein